MPCLTCYFNRKAKCCSPAQYARSIHLLNLNLHLAKFGVDVYTNGERCRADLNKRIMLAVLSLRNTPGFRRYALRAYAPLRPAMCSTAARSARIRRARHFDSYCCSIKRLNSISETFSFFAASLIDNNCSLTRSIKDF